MKRPRLLKFTIIGFCKCGCEYPAVFHVRLRAAKRCEHWLAAHSLREDRPIEFVAAFAGHQKGVA